MDVYIGGKSVDVVFFINIHSIRKSYVPSIILFIGLIKLLDNLLDVILIFDHFEKIGLRKFSPTSFIGYIRSQFSLNQAMHLKKDMYTAYPSVASTSLPPLCVHQHLS